MLESSLKKIMTSLPELCDKLKIESQQRDGYFSSGKDNNGIPVIKVHVGEINMGTGHLNEDQKKQVSPSRTYVAICNNSNFDGFYFRKFTLPMGYLAEGWETEGKGTGTWSEGSGSWICKNNADYAAWYFLNVLNSVACIERCITFEDYSNLTDQDEKNAEACEEIEKYILERESARVSESSAA